MIDSRLPSSVRLRPFFGAIVCALIVGCQGPPTPAPPANTRVGPVGDEAVLLALDCYQPMYQVDANGRVIKLRMVGRHLPDTALIEIGKLKELHNIDFYGVNLTDDGLAHLKDLPKLKHLGIGGTLITDQSLVHLEKMPSLQFLWVPEKTFSKQACDHLKEARDINVYPQ